MAMSPTAWVAQGHVPSASTPVFGRLSLLSRGSSATLPSESPAQSRGSCAFISATAAAAAAFSVAFRSAARQSSSRSALRRFRVSLAAYENELGVQAPLGFWDPLGFTDDADSKAYRRRRSVEFKHGRIAMLATMGYMTPEIVGKLPGYLSPSMGLKFADVPNGLAALSKVPSLGLMQILIFFGLVVMTYAVVQGACEYSAGFEDYQPGGTPGDYGWKVLTSADPEEKRRKLNADLANGRLAMVAIMAILFQNGLAGTTGPEMWIPRF
ncbi:unnamed protein product [Polarella glacialis]|uniref:Uncharacterized protein n=1 Tax=Polarella glacialis TaxID=89957 RepID=A0A813DM69_POLGL|nr:unnamed protein product [Polarella glacialis]